MNQPKMKILGYRVLVALDKVEADGLVIPDGVQVPKNEGVVVAVGDGRLPQSDKVLPFPVAIGDRVWMSSYGAQPRILDGSPYVLVSPDDIFAVLPEKSRIIQPTAEHEVMP